MIYRIGFLINLLCLIADTYLYVQTDDSYMLFAMFLALVGIAASINGLVSEVKLCLPSKTK